MIREALFVFLLVLLGWGAVLAILPSPRRRAASRELEMAVGMHPSSRTRLPALGEPTRAELAEMRRVDWDHFMDAIADCEGGRG